MGHANNHTYQLLKKHPTTNIKLTTPKQLKALQNNEFPDSKL